MAEEKRRDFLKKAGIFAGTLAILSFFNSSNVNAGTVIRDKESGLEQVKINDDKSIAFLPQNEQKIQITENGDWILTKRITSSYTYSGEINPTFTTLVPLPPGMFYPISQVWGYDYNFVKEVKINGTPISFSEFTSADKFGYAPIYPSRKGRGAFYGFAWCVSTSESLDTGDIVEVTMEQKELLDSVKGIRLGRKFMPDAGDSHTYSYPTRHAADDPSIPWDPVPVGREPDDKIFWIYPNTNDYAIVAFNLSKYNQFHNHAASIWESIKIGKVFRPAFYTEANTYQAGIDLLNIFPLRSYKAARLAVFHKPTGAISRPSAELIVKGENYKAGFLGSDWKKSLKLR